MGHFVTQEGLKPDEQKIYAISVVSRIFERGGDTNTIKCVQWKNLFKW